MPELPEVETIRRQLGPCLEGRVCDRLEILDARLCAPEAVADVAAAVSGRRLERVERHGKYLVMRFSSEIYFVCHLRMTGNLLYLPAADADTTPPPYLRARLWLSGGASVCFCDPRRFGTGVVVTGGSALETFLDSRLGIEPLGVEFTTERLAKLMHGRSAPVKAFLLSQAHVAGLGNIYADEALFRAGIHPLRPAGSLAEDEIARLRNAVVAALSAGIDAKGASIDDFRHADGARGSFQDRFLVHRREGEPCPTCQTRVVKLRAAGRATYVCPSCQTLAEAAPPRVGPWPRRPEVA